MLSWMKSQIDTTFGHIRNERGQSELIIVLLLVLLIFLLANSGRVGLQ